MDPDQRARFEDDYARTTGVLPGPVLKQVRAGLLSADPAAQAAAAQRLARLKDGNPALIAAIPADERRRAATIAEFADLGLPPARAVELAEEKLAGEDDEPAGGAGDDTLTGNGHENPAQQGNAEDGAKPAQADNAKSMPQSQVSQAQVSQGHPWPASPVRPKFGDELHKLESPRRNYQEEIPGQAWGRYQMTKPALKDLGMMDAKGNWTGKHGIHDKDDFLKNPKVQEKVLAEYMKRNLDQLRANGALGDMGQKISGVKAQITVTESGLLAAAHRQGAGMVKRYLDHQRRHNWTTNPKTFPKNKKDQFLSVETRLREFQNVPVWKP